MLRLQIKKNFIIVLIVILHTPILTGCNLNLSEENAIVSFLKQLVHAEEKKLPIQIRTRRARNVRRDLIRGTVNGFKRFVSPKKQPRTPPRTRTPSSKISVPPISFNRKDKYEKAIYEASLNAIKAEKDKNLNEVSQERLDEVSRLAAEQKRKELVTVIRGLGLTLTLVKTAGIAKAAVADSEELVKK